ncbi:MarR family transcriptional regulator [Mycobacterium simiae]|uniref:MarR family transcriptional regulator n=1 Tax=Mycobacterium simiae TaxID=1784 RepID=A0A5B1BNA6_MYCSI|nr:helix-turn-helix transcriptional regulator [Mycobacterium simiae]KAA1250188.1 MarR family transcriptional regulator [Mycobacterium simiae]
MNVILTEKQADVLEAVQRTGFDEGEWFRPMDIGGRSRTDHSSVLSQLERKGLVESRQRSNIGMNPIRGSKVYRLTDAGREFRLT